MIWLLLFALIFSSGDSVVVINKLDKYAKKHIQDKAKSKEFVKLIKDDRKQRKLFLKEQKKHYKELRTLTLKRDSKKNEFDSIFVKILDNRQSMQKEDASLKQLTPKYILEEEWKLIVIDSKKDLNKTIEKRKKTLLHSKKKYDKFEEYVHQVITDESRRQEISEEFFSFEAIVTDKLQYVEGFFQSDSSIVYQYDIPEGEMTELFSTMNEHREDVFNQYIKTYFKVIELTTEEEWKKLTKKIKKVKL